MAILSIQSHVAYGNVGNRAAVFPLELLGFDVWPINTVQFSNHTGYPSWRGEVFPAEHLRNVWTGIRDLGVLPRCEAVLSGYVGEAGIGQVILEAVGDVKASSPGALYCCDPVMGDTDGGLYVRGGVVDFMRGEALPRADIVTPNLFEAGILAGMAIQGTKDAHEALGRIHDLGPSIILVTSFKPPELRKDRVASLLSDGSRTWIIVTEELAMSPMPNGGGDLAAALFLGHYLRLRDAPSALELAVDSLFSVFEETRRSASRELRIIASRDAILSPGRRFKALELQEWEARASKEG
jgi:pyridoxine kinase